ncbi:hypothetical protein V5740_13235 [Croceibacterium sp. TMG7-5b_MA50]|uniref:O-antigen ligase family protein n=1 Tax=Croceibacterium sp. TMG7-5b_MA50 TaxID=3121290 RepID=UPI0032216B76
MENEFVGAAPMMPALVLWPVLLAFVCVTALVVWRTPSAAARFVIAAFATRFAASAIPFITFRPSPAGLSWNALISVGLVATGMLLVRPSRLRLPAMIPLYLLLLLIVISGVLNSQYAGLADMFVKYMLFGVMLLLSADAVTELGDERFLKTLIWPFALPLTLQLLSVALGVAKAAETDGSTSYIGGYNHEGAFSVMMVAGLTITCLAPRCHALIKGPLIVAFTVGIVLANYRTSILGALPLLAVTLATGGTRRFAVAQRPFIAGLMMIVVAGCGLLVALAGQERFSDLTVILDQGGQIIQPPGDFSEDGRRLLSGRAYIWSEYLYAYADGTQLQQLLGFGPNSWVGRFRLYAHNTLVSTLWELGVIGVGAMLLLWGWMIVLAARIPGTNRLRIMAALIGFILLAMATMPMWMIEGLMLLAVLGGLTIAGTRQRVRAGPHAQLPLTGAAFG